MCDLDKITLFTCSQNELSYFNEETRPSHGIENVNIIIVNKERLKNRKRHNVFIQTQQLRVASRLSRFSKFKKQSSITKLSSMPELNKCTRSVLSQYRNGYGKDTKQKKYKQSPFQSNVIVNLVSEHQFDECLNPFYYPKQTKFKIYRCQLGAVEDTCCCSCNSDAMFEVMKSLYDCYKKKNCDNCNCILCGHLPREERMLSEKKKSLAGLSEKEKRLGVQTVKGLPPPSKMASASMAPSEQTRRAKTEGLLTPLKNKTPEERERILKALANQGIPLPEGKSPSEKKIINKVRADLGLPIEPKTKAIRDKHVEAAKASLLQPLEGKTPAEKEKLLKGQHDMGIPLPKGRTPTEKSLIAKVVAGSRHPSKVATVFQAPSEKMRRAKTEGLLTPLKNKTPEERERILRALAKRGIPLPEGQSPSEKKLIGKVRTDLGLPIEPKTKAIRDKHEQAALAGLLLPLEGKTPAQKEKLLRGQHNMGIPLPVGRTPSERSLINKITAGSRPPSKVASALMAPSELTHRAKTEGLLTPLKNKTPEERERILRALAKRGVPLPEGQSPSEKKLIGKVRTDLGLPIEPKTKAIRDKHEQAALTGLLLPLEGKTPAQKENLLRGQHKMGIPLPVGRTPTERSLIAKITAGSRPPSKIASASMAPSEQMRRAKTEGLLTPLKNKTPEERERILRALAKRGIPLPEGQSPSEKKLIGKVRTDLGLPIEPKTKAIRDKHEQAALTGLLLPLEGKTPAQKEKLLRGQHKMGIPLPVGRTPTERSLIAKITAGSRPPSKVASASMAPSEQMRRAKAEGLLTPLKNKTPEERERILRALAKRGIPLPEGQSPSEKKLIGKVRTDLGLPIEPKTKAIRDKHEQAALTGLLLPLEGKTPAQKEKLLRGQHKMGIPLPVGRTPTERSLIAKITAGSRPPSKVASASMALSEQTRRAKTEGLLTPLKNKTPEERERILRALAKRGIPLPEGQSPSEKKLIGKVRTDLGLPIEPKNKAIRDKHEQAALVGLLLPLEGKTLTQKEKLLRGQHKMGIPLPVGRTPTERSLIAKIVAVPRAASASKIPSKTISAILAPSEHMRRATAEGLLTPLKGKTPEKRENILKALAMRGIPLPEGQSPSEIKLINKVRTDLGLPIEPKTKAIRDKHDKAALAGLLFPLEGKAPAQKEKLLRGQHKMGIPLPVGRTPSERSLIAKITAGSRPPSKVASALMAPSELTRPAKTEASLTPLKNKTPEERERILRALGKRGIPLPEGQTPSEKKLIGKVRTDLGLPIEPKTKAIRDKHEQAALTGLLLPLEGKTPAQKEKLLRGQHKMGIPLPVGRTPTERSLIAKITAGSHPPSKVASALMAPSEQTRRTKTETSLTPLKNKTPEERERILRALAKRGIPLPEGQTPSEKKLIGKVRTNLGLPIEPKTKAIRDKHEQAALAGLLLPLEGKTLAQKEKLLRGQHKMGIPLPVGRTPTERSLIAKITAGSRPPSKVASALMAPAEQTRRAKTEASLTPLKNKTPEERERILRALAKRGIPLPEGQSPSEKKLIGKVRTDLGLPIEPKTKAIRDKHEQAALAGLLLPLEGKTLEQKEKLLRGQHKMGIPLPVGRTPTERSLIDKIMASSKRKSFSVLASKRLAAGKEAEAGIATEYQDVVKTTTCDRGCGCDKKKIRFKHSYVKIRVTSPDISSFCDCPDECIPGVKSGAFIDNEGIKVTVGRAVGIPSLTREVVSKADNRNSYTERNDHKDSIYFKCKVSRFESGPCSYEKNNCLNSVTSFQSSSTRPYSTESENNYLQSSTPPYEGRTSKSDRTVESIRRHQPLEDNCTNLNSKTKSAASSLNSILVIKSEMSLCSTSTSKSMDIVSLISSMDSSITSNATNYSDYQPSDDPMSSSSLDEPTSDDVIDYPVNIGERKIKRNIGGAIPHREYTILRMSQTKLNFGNNDIRADKLNSETQEPIEFLNHLPSKLDVSKIIEKIMAKKRFLDASSIFIVVPMSDDDEEESASYCVNSITSIHSAETGLVVNDTSQDEQNSALRTSSLTNGDEQVCGKGKKFFMQEISSTDTETMFQNEFPEVLRRIGILEDESCEISTYNEIAQRIEKAVQGVGSDPTADRPSYCCHKEYSTPFVIQNCNSKDRYAANVINAHKTSRLLEGGRADRLYWPMRDTVDIEDKTSDWFRFTGIHTPSPVSAVIPYDVSTRSSVGSSQFPRNCSDTTAANPVTSALFNEGNKSFPDMRTPSPVSSQQGSSHFPGEISGSCCLSEMHESSTLSSYLLRDVPTCHSLESSHFPYKASSCCRSRDMRTPSTESSDMPRNVPTGHKVEASHFPLPDKATSCCRTRDMRTPSTQSYVLPRDVPTGHSVESSHFPLSDKAISCCRSRDMRTPSTESSDMPPDVPKGHSAKTSHLPHKTSSGSRIPDMRTPSASLDLLSGSYSVMGSSVSTNGASSCSRLPDMRTPSTISLEISRDLPTRSSVGPSRFPHKTSGCCQFPDMRTPSTMSSVLQSKVSGSCGVDWSCVFPSETYCCCRSPVLRTRSTTWTDYLCDIPSCSDDYQNTTRDYVPLHDSRQHSGRLRHNMHKYPTETSKHDRQHSRYKENHTPCCNCNRSKAPTKADCSKKETAMVENFKHTGPNQHRATWQSYMPKVSASEEDCACTLIEKAAGTITNQISSQPCNIPKLSPKDDCVCTPTNQISRQQCNIPKLSREDDCVCTPTNQISSQQCNIPKLSREDDCVCTPKSQISSQQCNIPKVSREDDCVCQQIKRAGTLTDDITSQQPRHPACQQPRRQISQQPRHQVTLQPRHEASHRSNMVKESASEQDGIPKDIDVAKPIRRAIKSKQPRLRSNNHPLHQASHQSNMPKDFVSEHDCICEDIDDTDNITDEISQQPRLRLNQQPRHQARNQSDMPKDFASEKDGIPKDTDVAKPIRNVIKSQQPRLRSNQQPFHQASHQSNKPKYFASEQDGIPDEIDVTKPTQDEIKSQKPRLRSNKQARHQESHQSNMLKDSASEQDSIPDDTEVAEPKRDEIKSQQPRHPPNQQPRHQESHQSNIPKDSASKQESIPDDIEVAEPIRDEIKNQQPRQQPRHQESHQYIMPKDSASEQDSIPDDIEVAEPIRDEIKSQQPRHPPNQQPRHQESHESNMPKDSASEQDSISDNIEVAESRRDEIQSQQPRLRSNKQARHQANHQSNMPKDSASEQDSIPDDTEVAEPIRDEIKSQQPRHPPNQQPRHQESHESNMLKDSASEQDSIPDNIEVAESRRDEIQSQQPRLRSNKQARHQANQQSNMPKDSASEQDSIPDDTEVAEPIRDEIKSQQPRHPPNQQPRHQESHESNMLKDSASEQDSIPDNIEVAESRRDEIQSQQPRLRSNKQARHQANQQSNMPKDSASEQDSIPDDTEVAEPIRDETKSQQPRLPPNQQPSHQANHQSKMPKDSASKQESIPDNIEVAESIQDAIQSQQPRLRSNKQAHHKANHQYNMPKDSASEQDSIPDDIEVAEPIRDQIKNQQPRLPPNQQPRHQESHQSNMPQDSASEHDCLCEDIYDADNITDDISQQKRLRLGQEPRHHASRQSEMPKDSSSEHDCICDYSDDEDTITDEISQPIRLRTNQQPRHHARNQFNMPKDFASEQDGIPKDIDVAKPIRHVIKSQLGQQPRHHASRQSKMRKASFTEQDCICEDIDDSGTITYEITSQQPHRQASQQPHYQISNQTSQQHRYHESHLPRYQASQQPHHQASHHPRHQVTQQPHHQKIRQPNHQLTQQPHHQTIQQPHHQASQQPCHRPSHQPRHHANQLSRHQTIQHFCWPHQATQQPRHKTSQQPSHQVTQQSHRQTIQPPRHHESYLPYNQACQHPRHRTIRQSEIPKDSTSEQYCICDYIDDADTITNEISQQIRLPSGQQLRHHASRQSKMRKASTSENNTICEDTDNADTITDEIKRRQLRLQTSQHSKGLKYSASEVNCILRKDIKTAGNITDEIISQQPRHQARQKPNYQASHEPRHKVNRQFKMSKHSTSEQDCICEDTDDADIITDGFIQPTRLRSSQQPRLKASRNFKKLKYSAVKENFENKGKERHVVLHEIGSRDPCFQATQSSKMLKEIAGKNNCACQQTPKDFASYGFCVCQDIEARNRLCIPIDQIQHQPTEEISAVLQDPIITTKSKITRIITSIKNTISHKIDEMSKDLDSYKTHKKEPDKIKCKCHEVKTVRFKKAKTHKSNEDKLVRFKESERDTNNDDKLFSLKKAMSDISNEKKLVSLKESESHKNDNDKSMSLKKAKSHNSNEDKLVIFKESKCHKIHDDKPVGFKESESHNTNKDKPASLKTAKRHNISEEKLLTCKKSESHKNHDGKPVIKESKSHKSSKKKSKVICPKPVVESPKTSEIKEEKFLCKCDEVEKVLCDCKEEKVFSGFKEEKVFCGCKEEKVFCGCKEEKVFCGCKQEKVFCECKEEKVFCGCKKEKVFCGCKEEKVFCGCKEEKVFCGCKEEKVLCGCKEEQVFCECSEDKTTSQKAEKESVKPKSHHIVQTIPEPESQPQQTTLPGALEVIYDGYPYEHNCGWIDIVELMRLRSQLTESTSGFKACKKRKQQQKKNEVIVEEPVAEIELDFEDAIKYYAGKNLELFRDLLPPLESDQEKYQGKEGQKLLKIKRAKAKKEKEKAKKKAKKTKVSPEDLDEDENIRSPKEFCVCPYGPPKISYETITLTPEASEGEAKWYPKGMKFCLGGTGLSPLRPAVAGTSGRVGVAGTSVNRTVTAT